MGDWIDDYMDYTEGTPTPQLFRLWAAITCIAGALERRVWIETAQSPIFPNIFTLMIAAPGIGKTIAINPIENLWRASNKLHILPNNVTKAALIDFLGKAGTIKIMNEGANVLEYHSVCVPAGELGVLLPAHDLEYLSALNYIYDNPECYREERRHMDKPVDVPYPQVTILAGTQPGFLSSILPDEAWHMGFLSRIIMIYAASSPRVPLFAKKRENKKEQLDTLIERVAGMSELYGEFEVEAEAMEALESWAEHGFEPIPQHSKLIHYCSRRVLHILKLTMIAAVSRSNKLTITLPDFLRAKDWLLAAEVKMPDVFKEMSAKSDGAVIQELHSFMWAEYTRTKNKPLHESLLYQYLQSKIPADRIAKILDTALRARFIEKMGDSLYIPLVRMLGVVTPEN